MPVMLSPQQKSAFAAEISALYRETKAKVGQTDLDHIAKVDQFSKALEQKARTLINHGKGFSSWKSGIVMLISHYTIEFSELGHNILHGQYDHLENAGRFHSSQWTWNNTMDEKDWALMHNTVHHPFTNIKERDHDLGYLAFRVNGAQKWRWYTIFQPLALGWILLNDAHYYAMYTSMSADVARNERLTRKGITSPLRRIWREVKYSYITMPLQHGWRAFRVATANLLARSIANAYLGLILASSHMTEESEVFEEVEHETEADYYLRQAAATVNFYNDTPFPKQYLDQMNALKDETLDASFADIFYGAINYHLEHHYYPDLPPNRLRELAPRVAAICEKYGVPYRMEGLGQASKNVVTTIFKHTLPTNESDKSVWALLNPVTLAKRIIEHARRPNDLVHGDVMPSRVASRVIQRRSHIDGKATSFSLDLPTKWQHLEWLAGSFINVAVTVNGKEQIRQYSLTRSSDQSRHLEFAAKRVAGGQVSNYLADHVQVGDELTIVGRPRCEFGLSGSGSKKLLIAGGVGITPIISMLRDLKTSASQDVIVLYFNRSPSEIIFQQEINELANNSHISVHHIVSDNPTNLNGFEQGSVSAELIQRLVTDLNDREVYICGPQGLMDAVRESLLQHHFPMQNFFLEAFSASEAPVSASDAKHEVLFAKSDIRVEVDENTNLLALAEELGIEHQSGCRNGVCKACSCRKMEGKVYGEEDEQWPAVTLCTAYARSNLVIDA